MALDTVPWMVAGGAVHSAEVGRTLAYVASNGQSGVTQTNDFLVRALSTPGTSVRVAPGSAALVNTYAGQTGQSYIARNTSDENVGITQTGPQARSDMLVLRIDDPQYGGTSPEVSVEEGPYVRLSIIPNVGPIAVAIPSGTPYPAIPLARIDIPANTGTITQAMIKDLRIGLGKTRTGQYVGNVPGGSLADYGVIFTPAFPPGSLPRMIVSGMQNNIDWIAVDAGPQGDARTGYVRIRNGFNTTLPVTANYIAVIP